MSALLGLALLATAPGSAATPVALRPGSAAAPAALRVERAVVLMRHGIRPPTKDPAMPAGYASQPWPTWSVKPGYLTEHGAAAMRLLGRWDRIGWAADGVLPKRGCPVAGTIAIVSDSDQRTIATGDAWIEGLAPNCPIDNRHRPQDVADPLFAAAGENGEPFDPKRADAAVAAGLGAGGIAAAERTQADPLARVDRILCGTAASACGVRREPSGVAPATPDERPKLTGALDRGSTAAQVLLLQYAEGKPMTDVGWGRASPADITATGALHAAEFAILARPPYIAARNVAPIARRMRAALTEARAARVTIIVGHDTNVASLGGLLGLHWQAPGFAADDPVPGGAIVIERLVDRAGRRFVRARYRAQSLDQLRQLTPLDARSPAYDARMTIAGCGRICPLARFETLLDRALR